MVVEIWNMKKLIEPFFPGKFIFVQIWEKKAHNVPQNRVFGTAWKILLVFLGKKPKLKTVIVTDISPNSPISSKILVLVLWAKMLFTNQIIGFFKT